MHSSYGLGGPHRVGDIVTVVNPGKYGSTGKIGFSGIRVSDWEMAIGNQYRISFIGNGILLENSPYTQEHDNGGIPSHLSRRQWWWPFQFLTKNPHPVEIY